MSKFLEHPSVQRVINSLSYIGHSGQVVELENTARSAEDAASALNVEVGAIVKTLIFKLKSEKSETPLVTLISGDQRCKTKVLGQLVGIDGKCILPDADEVKMITGYSIGGVSPIGMPSTLTILMDEKLNAYETIWAAAGHPHCVFPITFFQLQRLTNATVSDQISEPFDKG